MKNVPFEVKAFVAGSPPHPSQGDLLYVNQQCDQQTSTNCGKSSNWLITGAAFIATKHLCAGHISPSQYEC